MKIEELKQMKKDRGYTNQQIAKLTGLPLSTVKKIFSGETKSPRFGTLQLLEKLFQDTGAPEGQSVLHSFNASETPAVKESSFEYTWNTSPRGPYTTKDLDKRRGEDGRGELIDGVIIDLASPSVTHQLIQAELMTALRTFVKNNHGKCFVFGSPLDIHIDKDDDSVLQPDISVICDRNRFKNNVVWGAPDLVIEILSPSTRSTDQYVKASKYQIGGVREYWIVDEEKERIIVHDFEHDLIHLYTFQDTVPVSIWDGACEIDFSEIAAEIALIQQK